ncbi:MAG TPA: phenylalanine--tRNA ligase subunit beta [Candidatus Binatia bacterium]|nr:phenylalanine--tRNA ligase subunit beta [Candidatus Binatia bacterium]
MNFTFNWLSEFVPITIEPQELANVLTMAGLEVESLRPITEPETNRADWVFAIGVTPNRGDCLGIKGIAREVAAFTGERLKSLPAKSLENAGSVTPPIVKVSIDDPHLCARYSAGVLTGIKPGRSPAWLRFRLEACGLRAIDNIVDVTNYVMLETGQPLHAFDLDLLPARHIAVRPAGRRITFSTLDGSERELTAEDLLIWDGDLPVALAGIMGGINSEVSQNTTSILLESASFDPIRIRRTAKRLSLHSEASHRFERGVDPEGTVAALERAAALLAQLAGATPATAVVDRYARPPESYKIFLREQRIQSLLGVAVDSQVAENHFQSLGIRTARRPGNVIECSPPTSRPDLTREADLIEELARLYGYDKIPSSLPRLRPAGGGRDELLWRQRAVRSFLAGESFVEAINSPFTNERLNRDFPGLWDGAVSAVAVQNPLVKESGELRLSLIPGLIDNLRANLAQKAPSFHAYHMGKVFRLAAGGTLSEERLYLSGILYGPRERIGLSKDGEAAPGFLTCKGIVEGVFDVLRIGEQISWTDHNIGALHPGRRALATLDGQSLGYLGEIHPELCDELGLPPFLTFELDLEKSLQYAPRKISVRNLPRFPSVVRDFAVVVERDFQSHQIVAWINSQGEALIEHVEVFDEYRGAPIPEDKKSLAYKISYRAEDRTLTDAEINALHQDLVSKISKTFGAELRS